MSAKQYAVLVPYHPSAWCRDRVLVFEVKKITAKLILRADGRGRAYYWRNEYRADLFTDPKAAAEYYAALVEVLGQDARDKAQEAARQAQADFFKAAARFAAASVPAGAGQHETLDAAVYLGA